MTAEPVSVTLSSVPDPRALGIMLSGLDFGGEGGPTGHNPGLRVACACSLFSMGLSNEEWF